MNRTDWISAIQSPWVRSCLLLGWMNYRRSSVPFSYLSLSLDVHPLWLIVEINLAPDFSIKKNSVIAKYYKENSGEWGGWGESPVWRVLSVLTSWTNMDVSDPATITIDVQASPAWRMSRAKVLSTMTLKMLFFTEQIFLKCLNIECISFLFR